MHYFEHWYEDGYMDGSSMSMFPTTDNLTTQSGSGILQFDAVRS